MNLGNPRSQTKQGGTCAAASFQHTLPRPHGHRGGQQDGLNAASEPPLWLRVHHASAEQMPAGGSSVATTSHGAYVPAPGLLVVPILCIGVATDDGGKHGPDRP